VLDLGSGTGKVCLLAAQVVGPTGRVIGVDMLAIARRAAPQVAAYVGYANVEFKKSPCSSGRPNRGAPSRGSSSVA